jgi:hypothetical protein
MRRDFSRSVSLRLVSVLFFVQLSYMRDGMKDATAAAMAATRGAEAAIEANKLNREIFVASQRPWLDADVALASGFTSDGANGASRR